MNLRMLYNYVVIARVETSAAETSRTAPAIYPAPPSRSTGHLTHGVSCTQSGSSEDRLSTKTPLLFPLLGNRARTTTVRTLFYKTDPSLRVLRISVEVLRLILILLPVFSLSWVVFVFGPLGCGGLKLSATGGDVESDHKA